MAEVALCTGDNLKITGENENIRLSSVRKNNFSSLCQNRISSSEERIQWNYSCATTRISYKQFLTKNFAAAESDPRQVRFIVHSLYFNVIGAANCKELKVVRMLITVIWEFNPNRFPIVVGLNIADCQ